MSIHHPLAPFKINIGYFSTKKQKNLFISCKSLILELYADKTDRKFIQFSIRGSQSEEKRKTGTAVKLVDDKGINEK
ncbi:hypothetical protein [Salibacterium qingdaonense]|uniref:hypothetical protein n=1 Tax=Salibacterium qingdaonense TaxID=266892 RepID=UPI0011608A36|nr:hypothetical protein [Salibacterium qingdaonense]